MPGNFVRDSMSREVSLRYKSTSTVTSVFSYAWTPKEKNHHLNLTAVVFVFHDLPAAAAAAAG